MGLDARVELEPFLARSGNRCGADSAKHLLDQCPFVQLLKIIRNGSGNTGSDVSDINLTAAIVKKTGKCSLCGVGRWCFWITSF